jgi:hypothetical protein
MEMLRKEDPLLVAWLPGEMPLFVEIRIDLLWIYCHVIFVTPRYASLEWFVVALKTIARILSHS